MLSFFPRGVLDEILNLIESVSEGFPSSSYQCLDQVVVVVALLFYVHGKHLRSCRDGQLT